MNKDFMTLLRKIRSDHGKSVLTDTRKLRALLVDYAAGNYKGEIRNFLLALEEGLVARLQKEPHVTDAFLRTQASIFSDAYGLKEDTALFVVSCWAEVLGLPISQAVLSQGAPVAGKASVVVPGYAGAASISTIPASGVFTGKAFTNSIGMEFVLIPSGTFVREEGHKNNVFGEYEFYTLTVTISKPFFLGKYPVTQEEWYAVMGNNPAKFLGRKNPVEQVSWNDVQDFIKKLNQKEGTKGYRLPTEAEWEYAARAGSSTEYFFGKNEKKLKKYAWYDEDYKKGSTHPVGQKEPSPWGLYDIYGNVWEWVGDWYGDYLAKSLVDPKGPSSGEHRVLRGGCWSYFAQSCRSAIRNYNPPDYKYNSIGFRMAFSPDE